MQLNEVIAGLYLSQINCCISTYFDQGIRISIGDEINGWHDEAVFYDDNEFVVTKQESMQSTMAMAARWLHKAAVNRYPDSAYAREARNKDN